MRWKFFNVSHEIVFKNVKFTNKWEYRGEISKAQGKYSWIIGTLRVYHCFSLTEFLPGIFELNLSPVPWGTDSK